MPNYEYVCSNVNCECASFQTYQSIKEDPLKVCPYCAEESIYRTFHAVDVVVNGEPKTLGAWADFNRKKLGNAYCEDRENQIKQERLSANEFVGSLPAGASPVKREAKDTFWRKKNEKVDLSLTRMNKEQTRKFIMTGKKSIV